MQCDMKDDAKKQTLRELIKQMQELMASGQGEQSHDIGDAMSEVEHEMAEPAMKETAEDMTGIEDAGEPDEKKSFMKNLRPKQKGRSMAVVSMSMKKSPMNFGKGKKYG